MPASLAQARWGPELGGGPAAPEDVAVSPYETPAAATSTAATTMAARRRERARAAAPTEAGGRRGPVPGPMARTLLAMAPGVDGGNGRSLAAEGLLRAGRLRRVPQAAHAQADAVFVLLRSVLLVSVLTPREVRATTSTVYLPGRARLPFRLRSQVTTC